MAVKKISWPLVVLVFWIGALGWLVHDDQYQLFLAPGFGFLIYVSLGVCAVFCISLLVAQPVLGKDQLIKGMILLLPIVFMGTAGDNTLGSFALSKRPLAVVQKTSETGPVQRPDSQLTGEQGQDSIPEISLARLVRNWDQYNGRHIRVEGLFSKTIEGHDHLVFVFHPAFGYFADAYGLQQIPVETMGRSPKGKELSAIIKLAKQENARVIFVQPQFDRQAARKIADAINGAVVSINPLAYDYLNNMEQMANTIADALNP